MSGTRNLKTCISELTYQKIHTSNIRNKVLNDLKIIEMSVTSFMGTVSYFCVLSNGHRK
jgi:hypothetical protein